MQLIGGSKPLNLFVFGGVMPTSTDEFPFDVNDIQSIYENCLGGMSVTDDDIAHGVMRYDYQDKAFPGKGFAQPLEIQGEYRVTPAKVTTAEVLKPLIAEEFKFMLTASRSQKTNSYVTANTLDVEDLYFDYEFDGEISINTLAWMQYNHNSYRPTAYDIQTLVDDVWTTQETITASDVARNDRVEYKLSTPIVTSKLRIQFTTKPSSFSVPGIEFFSNVEPVFANNVEPVTWFLLMPTDSTVTFPNYPRLGERAPMLWGTAGGPNAEQDLALNSATNLPGNFLKLLNLKIKALPLGDLK